MKKRSKCWFTLGECLPSQRKGARGVSHRLHLVGCHTQIQSEKLIRQTKPTQSVATSGSEKTQMQAEKIIGNWKWIFDQFPNSTILSVSPKLEKKFKVDLKKSKLNFQYSAPHLSKTCLGKRGKITYFPKDPFTLPPTFSAIPANHLLLSQAGLTLHTD